MQKINNKQTHSIERIGRSIYPLRVFGFILFGISILLAQTKLGLTLTSWGVVGLVACIIYPHLAFLRYRKDEQRETELYHMQIDMALIGALAALIAYTPAVVLPYIIANSAANYALRGMTQVLKGLGLAFISAMLVGIFLDQPAVLDAEPIELLGPFIYLTIVTHYMGYLAYARGMSLIRRKKQAEESAQLDFLTGLNNRRSMFDKVKLNDLRPDNKDRDTTLIMLDLDYFKQINDIYGHNHGDAVLIIVSERIKNALRCTDIVARWGGEEFLVLLPNTNIEQGTSVAETIRKKIAKKTINYSGEEHCVTATLGVASYSTDSNFQETIQLADEALYQGKEQGRNQVVVVGALTDEKKPPPPPPKAKELAVS